MKVGDKERIRSVDGLRGIAACIVAFCWHYQHFTMVSPFKKILQLSYDYGWLMVELFFIISGFMMAYCYQENIINRKLTFTDYIMRRVRHLWPLSFVTLCVVTIEGIMYGWLEQSTFVYGNFDVYHWFLNFFLIQTGITDNVFTFNGPAWSISVEMVLYALFYVCTYNNKQSTKRRMLYTTLLLGGIIVFKAGCNFPIFNGAIARGIIGFLVGVLFYEIWEKHRERMKQIGYIPLLVLLGIYIVTRINGYAWLGDIQMLFLLFLAPMIIWCTIECQGFRKIMESYPLLLLGRWSLHIYMWHYPVQYFIKIMDTLLKLNLNYGTHIIWIIYVSGTLMVSALSCYVGGKIKSSLSYKKYLITK